MLNKTAKSDDQLMETCSLTSWHPFLEKISIATVSVPIPSDVLQYLRADFFVLPKECGGPDENAEDAFVGLTETTNAVDSEDDDDDDDEATNLEPPTFPVFSDTMRDAIALFGGGVFIKTNWHSPKDAFWITTGQTLRCRDISDVYQLLKASSFCKQDLNVPRTIAEPFLHLRRWIEIHPGTEFRCYVRGGNLIAISPRDWPQYHAYILAQKRDIINDIRTMFVEHIKHKFDMQDYCFDVVREQKDNVIVMDFSPYGPQWSEALAFEWSELDEIFDDRTTTENEQTDGNNDDDPEFRYVSTDTGIQPNKRNNYGIPKDVIDVYQTGSVTGTAQANGNSTCTLDDLFSRLRQRSESESS